MHVKVPWTWGRQQQQAFEEAKSFLKSPQLLIPYDTEKPLVLACDASPVVLLAHRLEDGSDRPIGYASRALTTTDRKYAQIDKEALAIVYGIKNVFTNIYMVVIFIIHTDHKPVMYLFNENRSIPPTASARIQRWALAISGYTYQIQHRSGTKLGNADGLSRLPLPTTSKVLVPTETVLLMERLNASLVTAASIKSWTDRDTVLAKVKRYTLHGWPDNTEDSLKQYKNRKNEISV